MTNSHDGRNAFSLHAGLFRLVCSNGLVVADQTFGQIKIKHQWYDLDQVKEVTDEVVESIPGIVGKVSKFEDRKLTPEEKIIFAKKAILTSFPWSLSSSKFFEKYSTKPGHLFGGFGLINFFIAFFIFSSEFWFTWSLFSQASFISFSKLIILRIL